MRQMSIMSTTHPDSEGVINADVSSPDHPQLHAQVPASGSHHQKERPHCLTAQPQVWGVPHLCLPGDCLHCCHGLPEPAGEWLTSDLSLHIFTLPTASKQVLIFLYELVKVNETEIKGLAATFGFSFSINKVRPNHFQTLRKYIIL